MTTDKTDSPVTIKAGGETIFTVESANRTLVLVRRIVQDVVDHYAALMESRRDRDDPARGELTPEQHAVIEAKIEQHVQRLNQLEHELRDIGCQLKDWSVGLVDFPAMLGNRPVLLCWKLGEPRVEYWHELHAGFAGRQPIEPPPAE